MVQFKSAWAVVLSLFVGGCGAVPLPVGSDGAPARATVTGDWNDVEAAVLVGASEAEMAVLAQERLGVTEMVFRLRTVHDRPATLRVVRQAPGTGGEPTLIELYAEAGRFGDAPGAERLVRAVADRLEDLAGVDYRPLD